MHIASDYIHPHKDTWGRPSHCRVCIYIPDGVLHAPVVVCSELRAAEIISGYVYPYKSRRPLWE
jgi:hypothetical protein